MSPVFKKVFGGVLATGVALALLSFIAFTLWSAIAPKPRSPQDFARLVEEKKARQAEMRREAANTVPLANISGSNLTTRPTAPSSDTVKLQLVEKSERVPLATLGDETTTVKQAATSPAVAKAKPVEKVEPIPMATVTGTAPTTRPADTAPLLVATKREPAESVEAIPLATIGGLTGAASKGQEVLPASIVAPARSIQRPDVILPSTLATKPTSAVTPTVFAPNTETGSKTPIETAKLSAADRKPERIAQATLVDKDIRTSSHRASDARELLQPITLSAAEKSGSVKLAGVPATQPSDSADRLLVITLETIRAQMPPPLETQREKDEKFLKADQDTVKIVTGFDCATPLKIEKISPTHFAVTITTESDLRNWFMFRVEGVKGKTVRIDISGAPLAKWSTLNPVYSYLSSLGDPAGFVSELVAKKRDPIQARNGPLLPDTQGQKWHYVEHVWNEGITRDNGIGSFCFLQSFEEDVAFIAMKTPYTPDYNERYLEHLSNKRGVTVCRIGTSVSGLPLSLVKISGGDESERHNPCIVLYAREHADEHDGSWVAQGAVDFILSETAEAAALREHFTFLVIPLLDPDGAVTSVYENITKSFAAGVETPESTAYAEWFRKWMDGGRRLDVVLNLHNVESAEGPHLFCALMESRRLAPSRALHAAINKRITSARMEMRLPADSGYMSTRIGGFLSENYGALHMLYEVNSQAPSRHLDLAELRSIGGCLVLATADFLVSDEGSKLADGVAAVRTERSRLWNRYKVVDSSWDRRTPFDFENALRAMPAVERHLHQSGQKIPAWSELLNKPAIELDSNIREER